MLREQNWVRRENIPSIHPVADLVAQKTGVYDSLEDDGLQLHRQALHLLQKENE